MESGTAVARPSRTERWPATTVVGPIEAQAARTPDAPALLPAGAAPVSYGELNAAANRTARCLTDRGARPGTVVGLALTRPAELVPALLAVAKTGAAYLPLDPDDAPGRLSWLLADAAPVCVLGEGVPDAERPSAAELAGRAATDPPRALTPQHPLCRAYGPGGRPAGVWTAHAEVDRRVRELQSVYGLGPGDRVLQLGLPLWEFLWPLRTGAALVLADPDRPGEVGELVREAGVTALRAAPSVLGELLPEPGPVHLVPQRG
ncbi:AMP-binding enzyme [Streptomyces sp. TLI_053]|uniref:AMP-binding protein n=1 Tax=Streptomyces sp. TLI_053 TaxID=1855352 RepID=UPI00087DC367|nr:AMP-binding protein [Streptomyces sp. TLI_053]SDT38108.1 AMP-binding enzyme [Streptomyces sp. TLI_053]